MERSHLELPSFQMRSHECHEEHFKLQSPEKLSRPQKRRKRAAKCAVREALCHTSALKKMLGVPGMVDTNQASSTDSQRVFTKPSCIESKLVSMEAKIDTVLSLFQIFWEAAQPCHAKPGELGEVQTNEVTDHDDVSTLSQRLSPDAPIFRPQSLAAAGVQQVGQAGAVSSEPASFSADISSQDPKEPSPDERQVEGLSNFEDQYSEEDDDVLDGSELEQLRIAALRDFPDDVAKGFQQLLREKTSKDTEKHFANSYPAEPPLEMSQLDKLQFMNSHGRLKQLAEHRKKGRYRVRHE